MTHALDERLAALRQAFDVSFAEPLRDEREQEQDFLVFRFASQAFALPTAELAAVERRRKLVPLPSAPSGCRGLAGVRGKLVAVYDLAALLGLPDGAELRWLILPRAHHGVALGVPAIERYLRAPVGAILARSGAPTDACVATVVHEGATLSVLATARLMNGVAQGGAP